MEVIQELLIVQYCMTDEIVVVLSLAVVLESDASMTLLKLGDPVRHPDRLGQNLLRVIRTYQ